MALAMLTFAFIFLALAIAAGIFGLVAAGPAAIIAFFVFFALFLATIIAHYLRDYRYRRPFK